MRFFRKISESTHKLKCGACRPSTRRPKNFFQIFWFLRWEAKFCKNKKRLFSLFLFAHDPSDEGDVTFVFLAADDGPTEPNGFSVLGAEGGVVGVDDFLEFAFLVDEQVVGEVRHFFGLPFFSLSEYSIARPGLFVKRFFKKI
jgi:hypothetical protein